MQLADLVRWLDEYLRIADVGDDELALNGLQVENAGEITRIAVAVDACQAVFEMAAAARADLLIVHHGLFWSGLQPITGRHHRRVSTLIKNNIALYGAHVPLDLHPEVGNNAVLADKLGMTIEDWWGDYMGSEIAVRGQLNTSVDELGQRLASILGGQPKLLPGGSKRVQHVGIVTGAGGSMIAEASAAGLDTLITGEGKHHSYFDAEELGINVFLAGHYATETVGVQALGAKVAAEHGLPWSFLDHPTGL